MFTLKLYRHKGPDNSQNMHKVMSVDHVTVMEIGDKKNALELWAFKPNGDYHTYFIGVPEEGMAAFGRDDLHLDMNPGSWWGWGLLENENGRTSEHYRPGSYGP